MSHLRVVAPRPPPKDPAGRPPPHDLHTELYVVAVVLATSDVRMVRDILIPDDFFGGIYRSLWTAAVEVDAHGHEPTLRAVMARLVERNPDDALVGQAVEKGLIDDLQLAGMSSDRELVAAARRLAELGHKRRMIGMLHQAWAELFADVGDYRTWLGERSGELSAAAAELQGSNDLSAKEAAAQAVEAARAAYEQVQSGAITGVRTRLQALDEVTAGIHAPEVTLITGVTGRGKSALAGSLTVNMGADGVGVGYLQLEDSGANLTSRMACANSRINAFEIRSGTASAQTMARYYAAQDYVAKLPIRIHQARNMTVGAVEGVVRRQSAELVKSHGVPVRVLVIDYVQKLSLPELARAGNREREVSVIGETLQAMGERLGIAQLWLSQVNDEGKIRESQALGMHAQNRWDVHRAKKKPPVGEAEPVQIRIPKQRNGPQDAVAAVWFHPAYVLFSDQERP